MRLVVLAGEGLRCPTKQADWDVTADEPLSLHLMELGGALALEPEDLAKPLELRLAGSGEPVVLSSSPAELGLTEGTHLTLQYSRGQSSSSELPSGRQISWTATDLREAVDRECAKFRESQVAMSQSSNEQQRPSVVSNTASNPASSKTTEGKRRKRKCAVM
eukprot:TRINITY_DN66436_c0_g1_i1.p2 TRINITY_DN66436_c0_g1~~TRINITY_DN66436_c0_g1_i1.p2  ORF type:complete len:186 (+),score=54.08 TRINITY_DN66436_c0_g1_i1:73-558(+)